MTAWNTDLSISGRATGRIEDGVHVLEVPAPATDKPVAGKRVLGAYLDLLHWMLNESQAASGRLLLPSSAEEAALDAIATLERERTNSYEITVQVGDKRCPLLPPDFSASAEDRAAHLKERKLASAPEIVERFAQAVDDSPVRGLQEPPRFAVVRQDRGLAPL